MRIVIAISSVPIYCSTGSLFSSLAQPGERGVGWDIPGPDGTFLVAIYQTMLS